MSDHHFELRLPVGTLTRFLSEVFSDADDPGFVTCAHSDTESGVWYSKEASLISEEKFGDYKLRIRLTSKLPSYIVELISCESVFDGAVDFIDAGN